MHSKLYMKMDTYDPAHADLASVAVKSRFRAILPITEFTLP